MKNIFNLKRPGQKMKSILIFFMLIFSFYTYSQTFSVSPALHIPGAFTVFADITVSGTPSIMDASFGLEEICFDITHPQTDDLTLWLISPDGTEILLSAENGGAGDNYTNTCFDGNQSNPSITSGTAPFTGNFLPEQALGFFNTGTINPNGIWKLKITDDFFFRSGTLNTLSMTFGNNPALVPSSPNDDCASAENLSVNDDFTCTLLTSSFISNAKLSPEADNCNFMNAPFDDDIWYTFTAISDIHEFLINNIIGSSNELIFQVSSGICGSITPLFCYENNDHNFTVNNLLIGNQYFLRIASKTNLPGQIISFDICIKLGVPAPPSNDECSGALAIPLGGSGCSGVEGTVYGATASPDVYSCGASGNFDNDVWFSFLATESSHQLFIYDVSGTATNLDFQLNHGSCASLSQNTCYFDPTPGAGDEIIMPVNNLTVGSTYYLRVATFNSAPQNTSFSICLGTPPPAPSNDNCAGAIELTQLANDCNIISSSVEGATGSQGIECDVSFEDFFDDDVWFKFTPTSNSHVIDIFNISGSTYDLVYEVLRGSCANLNPLICQDEPNDSIALSGLNQNEEYFIRVASYLDLVENSAFNIRIRHDNLIVCNDENKGPGTLREAVNNSTAGDTIRFDAVVFNQTIELDGPTVIVDHLLIIETNPSDNITLSNADINNTDVLISIQNELTLSGLNIVGRTAESMIMKIGAGGGITLLNAEVEKATIDK